jgi:hypothetical protein
MAASSPTATLITATGGAAGAGSAAWASGRFGVKVLSNAGETQQRGAVVTDRVEHRLEPHAHPDLVFGQADQGGVDADAFVQLHHGQRLGHFVGEVRQRGDAGERVGVQAALAAHIVPGHVVGPAFVAVPAG